MPSAVAWVLLPVAYGPRADPYGVYAYTEAMTSMTSQPRLRFGDNHTSAGQYYYILHLLLHMVHTRI